MPSRNGPRPGSTTPQPETVHRSEFDEAVARTPPLVKVEFAGVVQSTWKFQTSSWSCTYPKSSSSNWTNGSLAPVAGELDPARAAGRIEEKVVARLKETGE